MALGTWDQRNGLHEAGMLTWAVLGVAGGRGESVDGGWVWMREVVMGVGPLGCGDRAGDGK
jgi:hypothetical protein